MPTNSADFFDVRQTYDDPYKYEFHTKRRFSDVAYEYYVCVHPETRKVWRVEAIANFYSKEGMERAKKEDKENPSYTLSTEGTGYVNGGRLNYSGTTSIRRNSFNSIMMMNIYREEAVKEARKVLKVISVRYGKRPRNEEIRFDEGMIISVKPLRNEHGYVLPKIIVAAYDSNMARVVEELKRKRKNHEKEQELEDIQKAF